MELDNKREEKKLIGKCPVCGRGNIIRYHGNYICTEHFTNADGHRRCSFYIPSEFKGCDIKEETIRQLLERGESDLLEMKTNSNYPYLAKIVVVPEKGIEVHPLKKELGIRCPKCGGRILVTRQGYACENELKAEPTCSFFVGNKIGNRFIRENEVIDYLQGKSVILDGFQSNAGKPFSGALRMNEQGITYVDFKMGRCPNCGGEILVGHGAFNCSNYKGGKGCTFNIFREYSGHPMTADEVRELLSKGEVKIECTDTYGNKFVYKLLIVKSGGKASIKKVKLLDKNNE